MDRELQYVYSDKIPGDPDNFNWEVRFDKSREGYVGITQYDDELSRVLLSPRQVAALRKFLRSKP